MLDNNYTNQTSDSGISQTKLSPWSPLQFDASDKDKDSYLSTLTAFLAANPPGSLGSLGSGSVSGPEGSSSESSPSSSSDNANGQTPPSLTVAPASVSNGPGSGNDKRKNNDEASGAVKDRRNSSSGSAVGRSNSGGGGVGDGIHTHDGYEDDDDEDGKGKGGKTSDKRRAQNRQAQRAFRERKEKHLKELEDRVYSLEQQTTDQGTENAALKQLLEHLKSENERLKVFESAFSFTYAKDVSTSSSMPTAVQFGGAGLAAKPPTPPTSVDELDFSLPPFSTGNDQTLFNGASTISGLGNTPSPISGGAFAASPDAFSLSPAVLTSSSSTASATKAPTGSGLDHPLFFNPNAPSPASTAGDSASGSSANLGTPPDLTADLFSSYRDTGSSDYGNFTNLADFDTLFGASSDVNGLSSFLNTPSPPTFAVGGTSPSGGQKTSLQIQHEMFGFTPSFSPLSTSGSYTSSSAPSSEAPSPPSAGPGMCPEGKFMFDVDGLCSDLKAKAVCREAAKQALKQAMVDDARVTGESNSTQ